MLSNLCSGICIHGRFLNQCSHRLCRRFRPQLMQGTQIGSSCLPLSVHEGRFGRRGLKLDGLVRRNKPEHMSARVLFEPGRLGHGCFLGCCGSCGVVGIVGAYAGGGQFSAATLVVSKLLGHPQVQVRHTVAFLACDDNGQSPTHPTALFPGVGACRKRVNMCAP